MQAININSTVKVILTKKGQDILKNHNIVRVSDNDGYTSFILWELFFFFGQKIAITKKDDQCFRDNEILLVEDA